MKLDNKELLERLSTSRRAFNATAFAELDRNLSDNEREEWNAIYASFSSRSLLRNTVIGLESIPFPTDDKPEQVLTCMVVMRHLVKVLIPLPLFWIEPTGINPNSVIGADVDYIIIDPIVSTGWDTVLTECEEAGIPVIVIDRTIDDSDKYISWVGSNFKNEGLAAGEWLKAYTDAKGISDVNVLVIEGTTGASAQIGRTDGFKEIADANGWNILDSQTGDFTQAGGQEVMESYIKSYEGQFNVVVCQNDNEAFGAMDAMKAAGISYGVDGDVILISFDACTAGLEYVMSGDINADFECNPLAAPFVEDVIQQLESGSTPDKEVYMVEHWYVNEDILSSITVNGEEQELTVVTQEIVDAQY